MINEYKRAMECSMIIIWQGGRSGVWHERWPGVSCFYRRTLRREPFGCERSLHTLPDQRKVSVPSRHGCSLCIEQSLTY